MNAFVDGSDIALQQLARQLGDRLLAEHLTLCTAESCTGGGIGPLHLSIPLIALTGASLILLFGQIKPSKVIRQVDWVLLLFFASLFIVVHGVEKAGLMQSLMNHVKLSETAAGIGGIHILSLLMSQIVSNVPFTIVMLPLMKAAQSDILWLSLASASTLAGNATIIGAMAR